MGNYCTKRKTIISAEEAQRRMLDANGVLSYEDFSCMFLLDTAQGIVTYMAYLCQVGALESLQEFLQDEECMDGRYELVNFKSYDMFGGTLLHMVTYMNKGERALNFIRFLVEECNAVWFPDAYGDLPWQNRKSTYLSVHDGAFLGGRDPKEFKETNQLVMQYYLKTFHCNY